jgi:DNA-binding transcriptional LysR family regulator
MNWRQLDLNLLVVFDAVMEDRSVTRAGSRLGMTQPAISHALGRLRHALKDELFVRTRDGMEPTPRAEVLAAPIHQALQDLRFAIEGAEPFSPQDAERSFVVTVNNFAAMILAAPLAAAAATEAPRVILDIRPSGTLDLVDQLDRGAIDLALGTQESPGERFRDIRIVEDKFVAVVRADHPAAKAGGTLTAQALADLPHMEISSNRVSTDFVDAELAKLGLVRRVALRTPFLAAAASLKNSDMVAILLERTGREFARNSALQTLDLPFATPTVMVAMLWHRRFDDLPAHRWLRNLVLRVARAL